MSANCHVIVIFRSMAKLEHSGSQIPDAQSVKLTFSLVVTFYLTKTESRTKNLQHSSYTIILSIGTILTKKKLIFCKRNSGISKIMEVLELKGIFSESTYAYICVPTYQISSFQHISNEFQTGVLILQPPPPHALPQNEPLKSSARLGLNQV